MSFEYFEEFPIQLLHKFTEVTGFNITHREVLVVNLEYGNTFKGPAEDVFRVDRAATSARYAELSNFLHPVIYYYNNIPDGMCSNKMRILTNTKLMIYCNIFNFIISSFAFRSFTQPFLTITEKDQQLLYETPSFKKKRLSWIYISCFMKTFFLKEHLIPIALILMMTSSRFFLKHLLHFMIPFTIPGHPGEGNRITAAIYIIIHKLISMFLIIFLNLYPLYKYIRCKTCNALLTLALMLKLFSSNDSNLQNNLYL